MSPIPEIKTVDSFWTYMSNGIIVKMIDTETNFGTECIIRLESSGQLIFYCEVDMDGIQLPIYIRRPFSINDMILSLVDDNRIYIHNSDMDEYGEYDEQIIEFNSTNQRDYVFEMFIELI